MKFIVLFASLTTSLLASSTSSENSRTQLLSEKLAKPKYVGGESLMTKVKFVRGVSSRSVTPEGLPEEPEKPHMDPAAPLRKTKSDSLPRRAPRTSTPSLSPSDEELSPLHSVVEPRPFFPSDSPNSNRQRSRVKRKQGKFDGLTREELLFTRTEKKMQYLYTKALYVKAKLEYHEIKQHLLDNPI